MIPLYLLPVFLVANTGCNMVTAVVSASALIVLFSLTGIVAYAKWFLEKLDRPNEDRPHSKYTREVSSGRVEIIAVVIILGITFLVLIAFANLVGTNC